MTERRLAPLTALTTLTRRPARVDARARRDPRAAAAAPAGRSRVVDNAVYSEGRRVATPATAAESREELAAGEDRLAWLGLYRPGAAGARRAGRAVRPARARRRGRDQGAPAAQVRALRRHAVRRPQGGPVPGRGRGGRVRRAAPVPRRRLRHHRAAQRVAGPLAGAPPAGERAGAAGQGQRGGAVRDPRRGRRRVPAGRRRAGHRHRRDRDRGLPRRPGGVPAHLRALAGGARVPARRRAADRHPRRDHRGLRQVRRRRGAAQLPARRRRPRHPGQRAGRGASGCSCATSSPSTRRWSRSGRTRRSGS